MIAAAAPPTISLVIGAAIIWISYGVFTGVISAVRSRSLMDRSFHRVGAVLLLDADVRPRPVADLDLRLQAQPGHHVLPVPRVRVSITTNPGQWFEYLILPWLTLSLVTAATYTRLTRTSMLEVLGEDYIRTARSKGMKESRVITRHALRAALTPVVTLAGLDIGTALGGVIIVEVLFGIPGLGWTVIQAITTQDRPVILGITILATIFVVVANLIVDILYAVLDPRVRLY